jgi:hypothetical protein
VDRLRTQEGVKAFGVLLHQGGTQRPPAPPSCPSMTPTGDQYTNVPLAPRPVVRAQRLARRRRDLDTDALPTRHGTNRDGPIAERSRPALTTGPPGYATRGTASPMKSSASLQMLDGTDRLAIRSARPGAR